MDEMTNELENFKTFEVGEIVTGKVVAIEDKEVLVAFGSKDDGRVPLKELSSLPIESPRELVNMDDELTLKIIKIDDEGSAILSKRAVDSEKAWDDLEAKLASGEVFEAPVKDVVKGGLVVDVGVRGFIPASLVETHFVDDFEAYKGQTLTLKVEEIDREKNRVILSHRAVVEAEQQEQKDQVLEAIEEGQVLEGKVARLTDFGAFVDLGGIDGLVHISQLAHEHVEKASDIVSEGDTIKVKVLSIDKDQERISLSRKQTLPGPWEKVAEEIKAGDVVEGTVKRLVNFGAFVEVLPQVEGLVHISQISREHIGTPQEKLEEGQTVTVKVLEVNPDDKRLSLSIKELEDEQVDQEVKAYEREDDDQGFSFSDMIGDKLDQFKND
ncbi:30S ribosomal protein S1 [Halolactibacillus miurensis]|uniref:30S ribosomal protein S1 n=1 Tax=Halolactibacillus miurensis TaxID=306541 RepID=A0A1I6SWC3_9BACI|nr:MULTISPECIES: 30S ribosomal protein S1 [Halolactibacillus]GEM04317.1 30S ribosomal protein S1 [Halolactibacillus miurensis]SFS81200.1 small subunit ribosomal protein S1 [Halolactibacillus miurensis]